MSKASSNHVPGTGYIASNTFQFSCETHHV
ncbi:hypothetical protein RCH09_002908 [Actimicrobium sp. GrIS 1.19]|nr:hypothetical protein [Actimicrobium sp. GrIS 1.19]